MAPPTLAVMWRREQTIDERANGELRINRVRVPKGVYILNAWRKTNEVELDTPDERIGIGGLCWLDPRITELRQNKTVDRVCDPSTADDRNLRPIVGLIGPVVRAFRGPLPFLTLYQRQQYQ